MRGYLLPAALALLLALPMLWRLDDGGLISDPLSPAPGALPLPPRAEPAEPEESVTVRPSLSPPISPELPHGREPAGKVLAAGRGEAAR